MQHHSPSDEAPKLLARDILPTLWRLANEDRAKIGVRKRISRLTPYLASNRKASLRTQRLFDNS